MFSFEGVNGGEDEEEKGEESEQAGSEKEGGQFPHIAIDIPLSIPVGCHLLGKLRIEVEAYGEG